VYYGSVLEVKKEIQVKAQPILERTSSMKKVLLGFIVVLMAVAAQAQMGGVEKAIAGLEQQWVAASKAGNADGVAALLADNFVNLNSDATTPSRAQTLEMVKKGKWEVNQISDVKVTTFGNTAIATGAWYGKGTGGDGKAVDSHERWVDTWMKMPSDKWQCIASASAPAKM
jgi:ketosteroid isomerase-like protein